MSAALLTSDTPRWLFLAMVGLVAAGYLACGLLALTGRARARSARRRPRVIAPALAHRPKELTR